MILPTDTLTFRVRVSTPDDSQKLARYVNTHKLGGVSLIAEVESAPGETPLLQQPPAPAPYYSYSAYPNNAELSAQSLQGAPIPYPLTNYTLPPAALQSPGYAYPPSISQYTPGNLPYMYPPPSNGY